MVATANVPADEWGKRPIAGYADVVGSQDGAKRLESEETDDGWPNVSRSGFLVLLPSVDTSAPRADAAVHECFARA